MNLCTSKLFVPGEVTEAYSSKQRRNKLIVKPGIFHTLFWAFHKCPGKVCHFKRDNTQAAGGRTVKSAPQKAVWEQMAWVVLAAYPKATDTSHVIYFHMNLAIISLATSSRNQLSREKNPGLHFVVLTELKVMSRALNPYGHKVKFL